ncbi:MAG: site-specific DNA-methyltransferase [Chloroflexaceae bacterium]|nr:site-specific DNA-methyltransferase [Chloroflexaceae bacterium]
MMSGKIDLHSNQQVNTQSSCLNEWENKVILGDCLEVLQKIPDCSINLIVTSPPYADSRRSTYGGISPDNYVDWFLPIANELKRVLKDDGTFILNIKEKVVSCERHTYVIELILALKKQGWLWTEEYIWHKKNCAPGKWSNRFRDAWERCLQFNKQKKFKMNQDAVMVPTGEWAKTRLNKLGDNDKIRFDSQVGSGFGKNIANWVGRKMAYPSNVIHLSTECGNKKHSAAFPKSLPIWFIKLFSDEEDVVLDPFLGSGTTCVAACELNRNYIGIEVNAEYHQLALVNIDAVRNIYIQKSLL